MMPVTDLQVAAVRALITRDIEENRRLWEQLDEQGLKPGYFQFLIGAFDEAVTTRFRGKKKRDIVEWVADVRANRDMNSQIDPNIAERLILWVFDNGSIDDIDFETSTGHQAMLLVLLVEDLKYDEEQLDALLSEARAFTDSSLAGPGS